MSKAIVSDSSWSNIFEDENVPDCFGECILVPVVPVPGYDFGFAGSIANTNPSAIPGYMGPCLNAIVRLL